VKKLTKFDIRKLINETIKKNKSTPFGSGMKKADMTPDQKKIIGHTWLTHVKRKGSAKNEVGEVTWHSLNENGAVEYYDVFWPSSGITEMNISKEKLVEVHGGSHEHEAVSSDEAILERKKRSKEKQDKDKKMWYYLTRDLSDEWDEYGIDDESEDD